MNDKRLYVGALLVVAMLNWTLAQEPAPAQPPAEAQVAQEFKKAAPQLFREWLEGRPEYLRKQKLGRKTNMTCTSGSGHYVAFLECEDAVVPSEYRIDVRRTDSVLTPFAGLLIVPVTMSCTLNGAYSRAWSTDKHVEQIAACEGASYEQCLAAGAKPIGNLMKAVCDVTAVGVPFRYQGEEHLSYGWSEGKWGFQHQREEPPLRPSGTVGVKAAG